MQVILNRDSKIMLLRWLKQGYIESTELDKLQRDNPMTDEELDAELDHLASIFHDEECERYQRLGYCKCCKKGDEL